MCIRDRGQTLSRVGVYLKNDFFAHGQLYVAMSRVGKSSALSIFKPQPKDVKPKDGKTKQNKCKDGSENYMRNVVYEEILDPANEPTKTSPSTDINIDSYDDELICYEHEVIGDDDHMLEDEINEDGYLLEPGPSGEGQQEISNNGIAEYPHSVISSDDEDSNEHTVSPLKKSLKASNALKVPNKVIRFQGLSLENPVGKNLCFSNATVNALKASPVIQEHVQHSTAQCTICQTLSLATLTSTKDLKLHMSLFHEEYGTDRQQCPHEYITQIIDRCETLDNLTRFNISEIHQCQTCHLISQGPTDPYHHLSETLSGCSVAQCFLKNREDIIHKMCKVCCQTEVSHTRTRTIINHPSVLIIQLKRFEFNDETKVARKITDDVAPSKDMEINGVNYRLKSVIEHHGGISIDCGHYTATISTDSGWIQCNDSTVGPSSEPMKGYVFVYQKHQNNTGDAFDESNAPIEQLMPLRSPPASPFMDETASSAAALILKGNQNYIRKRKPMNITVADLEESMDEDDEEFKANIGFIQKRTMPRQKTQKEKILEDLEYLDLEQNESESDDDDDDDSYETKHIDEDDYSPPVAGSESPKYEGKGKGRGKKST